jgi:ribosomal protein L11 methyltransferase
VNAWLNVVFVVPGRDAEAWSEALLEQGALSISVEDAERDPLAEQPLFDEPGQEPSALWPRCRLLALFEASADAAAAMARCCTATALPLPDFALQSLHDQDWVRASQSQFVPIEIASRLWVVPTWHDPPDPNAINLRLDPGQAFGSGDHPTTRLCLRWLEQNLSGGESVLDYGCGSGILSIAAAKLGASEVVGIDIDPAAVQTARENAAANAITATFSVAPVALRPAFDIVIANILAYPLCALAPLLKASVRLGGQIVLSGIISRQTELVVQAYAPCVALSVHSQAADWVCLSGVRSE